MSHRPDLPTDEDLLAALHTAYSTTDSEVCIMDRLFVGLLIDRLKIPEREIVDARRGGSMNDTSGWRPRKTVFMRCHQGHETSPGLWNCPICTDQILDAARAALPALRAVHLALKDPFDLTTPSPGDHDIPAIERLVRALETDHG